MSTGSVGWYPYPTPADPDAEAYWDGEHWTQHRHTARPLGQRSVSIADTAPRPVSGLGRHTYVSGVTTGDKIRYVVLAPFTLGLSLVWWWMRGWLGRKRIA